MAEITTEPTATIKQTKPQRIQKAPPQTHLVYNGKLCTMYIAIAEGKGMLVVLPRQQVSYITDMYPVDMAHLFNECRLFNEHYKVRNYTIRVHRRDWEYSPHCHLQITMPRGAFESLTNAIGFQFKTNKPLSPPAPPPTPSLPNAAPHASETEAPQDSGQREDA